MTKKSGGLLLEKDKIKQIQKCGANFFTVELMSYITLLVFQFQFQVKIFKTKWQNECFVISR